MDIQTKICSSCKQELPLSSFSIDRSKKDNLRSSCKACKKTYDKEYIKKNNEVIKAKRTEYTKKNANRKAEYDKKRREEKREEINESKRKYYHERGKEVGKVWATKNYDKILTYAKNAKHKRREIERSTPIPSNELHRWEKEQIKICSYCGCDCIDNYHIDHIEPLSTGGEHSIDNLTIACPTCNLSKNNKSMIIWMIQNRVRGGSFNAE